MEMPPTRDPEYRPWMARVLRLAAIYNVGFGVASLLFPNTMMDWLGLTRASYPQIWQCLGMVVGVYGIGYWIAASDPLRHWPITLVGFLGKLFGPIGFVFSAIAGDLPWSFGWLNLVNDLVWLAPFAGILFAAASAAQRPRASSNSSNLSDETNASFESALRSVLGTRGENLWDLSFEGPVLVSFLRHAGCVFCREAMDDLSKQQQDIETRGVSVAIVMMSPPEKANRAAEDFHLRAHVFSDPQAFLYRAFELERGRFWQLMGPAIWLRGAIAFFRGYGLGMLEGDGFQMPGVFLIKDGKIIKAFRHQTAADRPSYRGLAEESCPLTPVPQTSGPAET